MDDRRRFTRIVFSAKAKLHLADKTWNVELLDLSLKGALVKTTTPQEFDPHHIYHMEFSLGDAEHVILMSVNITHQEDNQLGLRCHHIDIDSATVLRRMIELNIGNDELLNRDIEHLSHFNEG
ncbi:PilZ domain-containing protein [Saccharobesus litoralis]|uniref:Cyclic diguanosine monophosphate-binding protein n=1 Tax=Saccharobesus litoralis TaxID=2172099 RepID=A0A2S0VTV1_9ALTE|nr:PilZ domain-containing protein [Saccharobesus litoralis]AWB67641.1 PilZ domain-containing protein [Saccharobesus litoralis]